MPLALDDDQRALADAAAGFARRSAPVTDTRTRTEELASGSRAAGWPELVRQGLHAIHLPEDCGGAGAGLAELAVVAEQFGKELYPGAWLPTVIASAVAAQAPAGAARDELLAAFAEGATGALVTLSGAVIAADGDEQIISGVSAPVLGLPGAEQVLVRAVAADGPEVWFRLPKSESVTVHTDSGVDLTRSVGRLELDELRVGSGERIDAPDADTVDLIVGALYGAESAGIASRALSTAVEYVASREQFGRPVGSFQAVQHKAARMLVRTEIATAAAWDAARAAEESTQQRRLTAAQAALTAAPAGAEVVFECVTLLGGVGFTWEHDAHLYWRRGLSIAAMCGPVDDWARRLGEAALDGDRDFSFVDADELPELRAWVGEVLDEVSALPTEEPGEERAAAAGGAQRRRLAELGLVAPHYPKPYGLAAGPREQAVIADEFAHRGVTAPSMVIGEWVLPTLLMHGSEGQQQRFIEPTLRGELVWCQLFSEPGAGSDLAALSTRATKVPGGWSISGQKVWTSSAHEADWGVCLARTDAEVAKHKGISYFLVDMRSAGIEVRPLKQSTGRSEFNEVFLDDVFVPDDLIVGQPGEGWKFAVTTLSNERLKMGTSLYHGSAQRVKDLLERGGHAASRTDVLRALGRNTGREMALAALNLRSVLGRLSGLDVGAEISVQKVFNAMAQREGAEELFALLGPAGAILDGGDAMDVIGTPAVLFGGGTIEIQLNVIAQRVLGLPR